MFVRKTPNSDACVYERPEFNTTDASASVLHSLTPFSFFEHANFQKNSTHSTCSRTGPHGGRNKFFEVKLPV